MLSNKGRFYVLVIGCLLLSIVSPALANSLSLPGDTTSATSSVNEQVTISKISITGNKKTKSYIIFRELSIQEGESYSRQSLDAIFESDEEKLMNTRLFNNATISLSDTLPEGNINVLVQVEERWYTFPAPIFKIADRNFNVWWNENRWDFSRVYYGVRLIQENVGGRNERLKFIAQFGFLKNFQLHYRFPYIDAKKTKGLSLSASYLENKNLAVNTAENKLTFISSEKLLRRTIDVSAEFFFRPNYYMYHNLRMGYQQVGISDTVANLNTNYLLEGATLQRYLLLKYSFRYDKRDYVSYATDGYFLNLEVTKLGTGVFRDLNLSILDASYSQYWPLKHGFFLSGRLAAHISMPDEQPYHLLSGLGFQRDFIRGYELYVMQGQHFALQKMTFKKRILSVVNDFGRIIPLDQFKRIPLDIYLKTYYDSGYVNNTSADNQNSRLVNGYLWGTGIGLDIVTYYDSVLTLEYSFNSIQESGFFFSLKADI